MRLTRARDQRPRDAGFTLIELLTVVAIIAILAAVALPNLIAYTRTAKIRGAAQNVKAQLMAARSKAIMKNANTGVLFVALSPTTYRYVYEDDMVGPPFDPVAQNLSTLLGIDAQLGPLQTLPEGIQFRAGGNNSGLRYDRLGAWHDPGDAGDPANPATDPLDTGENVLNNDANDADCAGTTIVIDQRDTGFSRTICVSIGGRVLITQLFE